MSQILIVEDDESVSRYLQQALAEAGLRTVCCPNGQDALLLARQDFRLILLDGMLPGLDGFDVCAQMRGQGIQTPILFITARDRLEDKVRGLDLGADDYLVKPFALAELLARVRALLRRNTQAGQPSLQVGELRLDPAARKVTLAGKSIGLSSTEFALLEVLMRNSGRVVTRRSLLEQVWDYDFNGQDNVLDVYISYLRSKLDRRFIVTVRGVGYRLEAGA